MVVSNARRLTLQLLKRNAILNGLNEAAASLIMKNGELVELETKQRIYEPEQLIEEVYFPIDCVLSIVSHMNDGSQIEIGTIGREGMSAFPLLMGASATANDAYCQVPGRAVKIGALLFHQMEATFSEFRQLLDRYLQGYVNMLGQLAACNRLHSIYERCARWLLMSHDRVDKNEISLTHEYLAMMLGTGRSGVTIAAATLQQAGFIRYAHGKILILNRLGLEGVSCECYEVARQQFGGLLRRVEHK